MELLELFNHALRRCGIEPLLSAADDRPEARLCNAALPHAADQVLSMAEWDFSGKRATLSLSPDSPDSEFTCSYLLPPDFLALREVVNHPSPWSIEGSRLLSNARPVSIVYTARIHDVTLFPPMVAQCLVLLLASSIASSVVSSQTMAQSFLQELQTLALPNAKTVNAAGRHYPQGSPLWIDQV